MMMVGPPRFAGRIALVTGAARGIGEAIARRLGAEGARVVIADKDIESARAVASSMTRDGCVASVAKVDIDDADSIANCVEIVEAAHKRCDILVNNAAINDATALSDLDMRHFRQVQRVNLDGPLAAILGFLPLIRRASGARILNISSIMGLRGSKGSLAYSTAKGGLVNMTRALACELAAEGVIVNTIAPGFIDTQMALMPDGGHEHETQWFRDIYIKYGRIPLGRAGQPDDVAGAAAFFCSDDCRYVTGQVMFVDGGLSATF
jgi:NAD(P)-dependent dehydrogenase (short-subunit alcohol dehydrogenase family)